MCVLHRCTHTWTSPQRCRRTRSSLSCGCQRETAALWKAQFKFILYLLELLLHFTARLSLWLEQSFVLWEDVKVSLQGCYSWPRLLSQLYAVCGELIRVWCGVHQRCDDLVNQGDVANTFRGPCCCSHVYQAQTWYEATAPIFHSGRLVRYWHLSAG